MDEDYRRQVLMDLVRALETEIGYGSAGERRRPEAIICAWTRLLAEVVSHHAIPQLHAYGDKVQSWARQIETASDDDMLALCGDIHDRILAVDNDDGWPGDQAGSALNAVCLGARYGLDDLLAVRSRWPAEASQVVWRFATGAGNANEVVAISRQAWQRHIYGQALALARRAKP